MDPFRIPQPNDRMLIGLDVDGVVADLIGSLLHAIRQRTGQLFLPEHVQSFNLRNSLGNLWTVVEDILSEPGFARDLSPYPGAIDGIIKLRSLGRVVFVTSPFHRSPTWSHERAVWLHQHTGTHRRDIVHLDDKTVFAGHVLIDDAPHQLEAWVNTQRPAVRVVRPWNQDAPGLPAHSWDEIVEQTQVALEASTQPDKLVW